MRYSHPKAVRQNVFSVFDNEVVRVDPDADGAPVGIELVELDYDARALGRKAGEKYGLLFPNLAGHLEVE